MIKMMHGKTTKMLMRKSFFWFLFNFLILFVWFGRSRKKVSFFGLSAFMSVSLWFSLATNSKNRLLLSSLISVGYGIINNARWKKIAIINVVLMEFNFSFTEDLLKIFRTQNSSEYSFLLFFRFEFSIRWIHYSHTISTCKATEWNLPQRSFIP